MSRLEASSPFYMDPALADEISIDTDTMLVTLPEQYCNAMQAHLDHSTMAAKNLSRYEIQKASTEIGATALGTIKDIFSQMENIAS